MRGAQRVITFCLLTAVLPTILLIIPLYLRHNIYADVTFAVAESDVVEIVDGVSSIFCQEHTLKMNTSFQAFQVTGKPQLSNTRKHIRLKKSMSLPDDTLEYWGFYLLKGSTVALSVCSRYDGSRILVVKGERNLRTCGLLDHSVKPWAAHMANGQGQVRVTFETDAQEIRSESLNNLGEYTRSNKQAGSRRAVESTAHDSKQPVNESTKALGNTEDVVSFFNEQYEGEVNSEESDNSKNAFPTEVNSVQHRPLLTYNATDNVTNVSGHLNANLPQKGSTRKRRHARNRLRDFKTHAGGNDTENVAKDSVSNLRSKLLEGSLNGNDGGDHPRNVKRVKRRNGYLPIDHILDGGIGHGHGGGGNESLLDNTESSVSSFENSLLTCYDGQILLVQGFPPSQNCTRVQDVESNHIMKTTHEVVSDGYYYYIFYSDNDVIENDIHAIFDIHKTTYQYTNYINGCINKTECTFPMSFWADETVIVEVPTRDGIEHEDDDITFLVSSCYPRMTVYIIFPVMVLFLILGCAFL